MFRQNEINLTSSELLSSTVSMEAFHKSFESLNEYQKAAVIDHRRVLLVNSQVGSGKTTVLLHKLLYLHFIKKLPLQSMVVLTFTNKAAQEIKDRLKQLNADIKDEEMKFFGTFHGVARTLLADVLPVEDVGYSRGFTIADSNEMVEIYERIINENKLSIKYKSKLQKRIDKFKQGQPLYANMKQDDDISEFLEHVKIEKRKSNVMDFDDLIDFTVKLLPESDFRPEWIVIDEFQDCDKKQLQMIEHMTKAKTSVFAVGDPNQVIYTWRGGSKDIFREFKLKYDAAELTLPINYRSTSNILKAARVFMEPGGALEGVRDKGKPIIIKKHHNSFNEAVYLCDKIKQHIAEGDSYSDIAIFYRKQKQAEVFRDVFAKHELPCEVAVKKTLRDIPVMYWMIRLLKASVNRSDKDSLIYILCNNRYGAGITLKKAKELIKSYDSCHAAEAIEGEIINCTRGFEAWCRELGKASPKEIYDYFDLSMFLMPTSISFEEDKSNVLRLLEDICSYAGLISFNTFEGIKEYVDKSALYGNQVINEGISKSVDSVKLMTLHASKGLEFKHVYISGANLGNIPMANKSPEGEQEEQRLFFVGITRAKDSLEISYHSNPDDYGVYGVPSPYLRMIPEELIESEDLGSRASSLNQLRREIKNNIDNKSDAEEQAVIVPVEKAYRLVLHDKYGEGRVISEDESNVLVDFPIYGEKTFIKLFSQLKYKE